MKKLIIFDLDGTLTNTSADICDNVNKTLVKFGYAPITLEETKRFVGNGARLLVERALKGAKCDNFEDCLNYYNNAYNYCGSPKTYVYDGMIDLMKELKINGYKLAVISNKPQAGTDEVYKKFFGSVKVDYVFGQREGIKIKPDKACVEFVLKEFGIDKKDALFIGDSDVDALTAINAKVDGISVLWGYRNKEELIKVGAVNFASTAEQLRNKIMEF